MRILKAVSTRYNLLVLQTRNSPMLTFWRSAVRKAPIHSFARLVVNILPSRTIASRPQKAESDFKYKAVSLDGKEKEIRLLTLEPGEWS
jgi:hypothetical protein